MVIAFPPCTYLSKAAGHHNSKPHPERKLKQDAALDFFLACLNANTPRAAVENPIPVRRVYARIGRPSTFIEPYEHGHPYKKKTCLWLRGLPPLMATRIVKPVSSWYRRHHSYPAGSDKKLAARTFEGVARAMATQWQ